MYAVVGCRECRALWVLEGRPDTTQCPRCGTRRQASKLRRFVETDDADEARQARASLLAERQDAGEAFAELDSFAAMESRVEDAGMDDETYLDAAGVDGEAVEAAAERAERGAGSGGSNRAEVVRAALRDLETPDEAAVVAYATERGVPESAASDLLDRLVRRGEATESGDGYRLL